MTEAPYVSQIPLFNSPLGLALIELGALVLFIVVFTCLIYCGLAQLVEWWTKKEWRFSMSYNILAALAGAVILCAVVVCSLILPRR